jgi:hypothetical protein|tara:strand:- start:985 stop:1419 length:435 start_codon:yes stop_codon:yes gene_type:complete
MEIKIPKQDLKNIFDVMTFLTSTFPSCSESILKTAETAYNGLALEVKPLEFKRTRQQEGYYRKWCREFGNYCGLTPDEMHEELLCAAYGSVEIETKFGIKRRPVKRSGDTRRQSYSTLIDTLIRVAAEMDFVVPPAERSDDECH